MNVAPTEAVLRDYYAWHSRLYDLTRWSFLFGRSALTLDIAGRLHPRCILEVGCGTASNLHRLGLLFPAAMLVGVDASADMLALARRRLARVRNRRDLREGYYRRPFELEVAPDLVIFSYALTMMNPGVERVVEAAMRQLAPGGWLAAVDFHATGRTWFRRWMGVNHVRMEGDLLPLLEYHVPRGFSRVRRAYGGLWEYFTFLGQR